MQGLLSEREFVMTRRGCSTVKDDAKMTTDGMTVSDKTALTSSHSPSASI